MTSSPMTRGPQITRPQSTGLSGLGVNAGVSFTHKLQPKPKKVPEFKDAP